VKRLALGLAILAALGSACVRSSSPSLPPTANSTFGRSLLERHLFVRDAKSSAKLYVSDPISNKVEVYDAIGKNQQPIATITDGISGPAGMTVDVKGDLYVADTAGNAVAEYAPNGSSPLATYSQDLLGPVDVAVDSKGNVDVANFYEFSWSIVEFPPGSETPSLEIRDSPGSAYSVGLTLDAKDTLYASYQNFYSLPSVYDYAPGSSKGTAILQFGPPAPGCYTQKRCILGGLLIDTSGNLLIADGTLPGVEVFPHGKTTPSKVFARTGSPQSLAFTPDESDIFVADKKNGAVNEYTYPGGALVNTIKSGLKSVYGVAVNP
jgi:hypothetical protein